MSQERPPQDPGRGGRMTQRRRYDAAKLGATAGLGLLSAALGYMAADSLLAHHAGIGRVRGAGAFAHPHFMLQRGARGMTAVAWRGRNRADDVVLDPKDRQQVAFPTTGPAAQAPSRTIKVIVSVDWEGRDLYSKNLRAMEQFREEFPEVPLLHFMNPAYFTKKKADAEAVKRKIAPVFRDSDEFGLHLHCWRSLVVAAGLKFRRAPRTAHLSNTGDTDKLTGDDGYQVPLTAYRMGEVRALLRYSRHKMAELGYGKPVAFRAGFWCASNVTLEALALEGFTSDCSELPPEYLRRSPRSYFKDLLSEVLEDLRGGTTPTSQPRLLEFGERRLLEVPNNGALADYVSGSDMLDIFEENVRLWQEENASRDVVVSIGFHQESATLFIDRVAKGIRLIQQASRDRGLPLEFVTSAHAHDPI